MPFIIFGIQFHHFVEKLKESTRSKLIHMVLKLDLIVAQMSNRKVESLANGHAIEMIEYEAHQMPLKSDMH